MAGLRASTPLTAAWVTVGMWRIKMAKNRNLIAHIQAYIYIHIQILNVGKRTS